MEWKGLHQAGMEAPAYLGSFWQTWAVAPANIPKIWNISCPRGQDFEQAGTHIGRETETGREATDSMTLDWVNRFSKAFQPTSSDPKGSVHKLDLA